MRGWDWDYGPQIQSNLDFPSTVNWDYGISHYLNLGLWDYADFEIGITGLQDPPMGAVIIPISYKKKLLSLSYLRGKITIRRHFFTVGA